jgi:enoyl-CoA hydratase
MSDSDELVLSREGAVLVARLNRPERRNALSISLVGKLAAAARAAEESTDIRVLLLTGTGDKVFCAGMDLAEFAGGADPASNDPDAMATFTRLMYGQLAVPVVAAVNGAAAGGGLELLFGADVIVAADTARFGLPEVKRGLFPAGSGTLLGTRMPQVVALELALTGDLIGAARAYELGLVNRVVPPEDVMPTAIELAGRIAANGPLGLAATKELIRAAALDVEAATKRSAEWATVIFSSNDAREGATAFVEKRTPQWTGT